MGANAPSDRVIETVSRVTGRDPLDLPPLYEVIDPDALDDLFRGQGGDAAVDRVQFEYAGRSVTVAGDGTIDATPTTDAGAHEEPTRCPTDD